VGAPNGAGAASGTGLAYLISATSGATLRKLIASDGVLDDGFGSSVAMHGRRAVVGAPLGHNPTTPETGAAYLFDAFSGAQLVKINAPSWSGTDSFGQSVGMTESTIIVGAPYADASRGAVYAFSGLTAQLEQQIGVLGARPLDLVGGRVAIAGTTVIAGATADGELGSGNGAAYFIRPVVGALSFFKTVAGGDYAPGTLGARFLRPGLPAVNDAHKLMFSASLAGTTAARNSGVWDTLSNGGPLDLAVRKGDIDSGAVAVAFGNPILNDASYGVFQATLTPPSALPLAKSAIYASNGSNISRLIRLGDMPLGGNEKVTKFVQLTQSSTKGLCGLSFELAKTAGVTLSDDSGILTLQSNGTPFSSLREGATSPTGDPYGQFSRAAFPADSLAFAAALQSPPSTNQAVFVGQPGMMPTLVARKMQLADGANGATFASFPAVTVNKANRVLFRGTLQGAGVTAQNSSGLWSNHSGAPKLVARANDPVPGLPGVTWASFSRCWSGVVGVDTQILFLARMKGAGVTTANDHALWLVQEDGSFFMLMREGDGLPDHTAARIGVIQNVVCRPDSGHYVIQASLANAPATTNLALFAGNTHILPMTAAPLRRPTLALRKGGTYHSPISGVTTIKSISLSSAGFDSTGAGQIGLSSPVNAIGLTCVLLTFSDGSVELVRGLP
jgi:hypothetical protein